MPPGRRGLRRHGLARLVFGLICALAALDFILLALSWATPVPDVWGFRGDAAIWGLAFGLVGQLLARRRPRNPIGWLFLLAGLVSAIGRLGIEYSTYVLLTRPGLLPGGSFAAWMAS
jgi:two-component system NarL family sensor kinase